MIEPIVSVDFLRAMNAIDILHGMEAMGLDETPDADTIRDAFDVIWAAMSKEERNKIRTYSERKAYELPPPN